MEMSSLSLINVLRCSHPHNNEHSSKQLTWATCNGRLYSDPPCILNPQGCVVSNLCSLISTISPIFHYCCYFLIRKEKLKLKTKVSLAGFSKAALHRRSEAEECIGEFLYQPTFGSEVSWLNKNGGRHLVVCEWWQGYQLTFHFASLLTYHSWGNYLYICDCVYERVGEREGETEIC